MEFNSEQIRNLGPALIQPNQNIDTMIRYGVALTGENQAYSDLCEMSFEEFDTFCEEVGE